MTDQFGISAAISGDTIVVGAHHEDGAAIMVDGGDFDGGFNFDAGAAYVFVREGTRWNQRAYLKASNTGAGDTFGWSVAVSENTRIW